jgi:ubiquinone/menaquinone biosynthesis C-methylase UbiE
MLSNETDMAFRRRALAMFSYLDLQDEDNLFECGCGRGFYLSMIRELSSCTLSALELDPECLEIAKNKLAGRNVTLIKANAEDLPFESNKFSKILFSEVLEHIPNQTQALKELHRVLKSGGTLALSVPNANYPFLWDPINWTLEALGLSPIKTGFLAGIWANHHRLYTQETLSEVVSEAGFVIEDIRPLTYFCFPFSHNIVYGIGKELLIRGMLPDSIAKSADRFTYNKNSGTLLNPVNLMRFIFRSIDTLNDRIPAKRSSVVLAMKLRKL